MTKIINSPDITKRQGNYMRIEWSANSLNGNQDHVGSALATFAIL